MGVNPLRGAGAGEAPCSSSCVEHGREHAASAPPFSTTTAAGQSLRTRAVTVVSCAAATTLLAADTAAVLHVPTHAAVVVCCVLFVACRLTVVGLQRTQARSALLNKSLKQNAGKMLFKKYAFFIFRENSQKLCARNLCLSDEEISGSPRPTFKKRRRACSALCTGS